MSIFLLINQPPTQPTRLIKMAKRFGRKLPSRLGGAVSTSEEGFTPSSDFEDESKLEAPKNREGVQRCLTFPLTQQ